MAACGTGAHSPWTGGPDTNLRPLPPDCGSRGALIVEGVVGGREEGILEQHLLAQTGPLQRRVVLVLIGLRAGEHGDHVPKKGRHLEERRTKRPSNIGTISFC